MNNRTKIIIAGGGIALLIGASQSDGKECRTIYRQSPPVTIMVPAPPAETRIVTTPATTAPAPPATIPPTTMPAPDAKCRAEDDVALRLDHDAYDYTKGEIICIHIDALEGGYTP